MVTDAALLGIAEVMAGYPAPWGFCGGWAIDLYIGRLTRSHKDVDIAVLRRDQLLLQSYLRAAGWSLDVAHGGTLEPWPEGERIKLPRHGVWCRNQDATPDFLEVLLNEADGDLFRFRRDPTLTRELDQAFLRIESGVIVLAPEIVLLYKSNDISRDENQADFENACPALSDDQRGWLATGLKRLSPNHSWLQDLSL